MSNILSSLSTVISNVTSYTENTSEYSYEDMSSLKPMIEIELVKRRVIGTIDYSSLGSPTSRYGEDALSGQLVGRSTDITTTDTFSLVGDDKFLMSFSTKCSFGSISNIGVLKLYDKDLTLLQNKLSGAESINYRFGYYTSSGKPLMSEKYIGIINRWSPSISEIGTEHEIELTGVGQSYLNYTKTTKSWDVNASANGVDIKNKISNIARSIAAKNKWNADGIVETAEIEGNMLFNSDEGKKVKKGKQKVILQKTMSDIEFLSWLSQYAKVPGDSEVNKSDLFWCGLKEEVKDKKTIVSLIFKPMAFEDFDLMKPKRIYNVFRNQRGINPLQFDKTATGVNNPVIRYEPKIESLVLLTSDTGLTALSTTVDYAGNYSKAEISTGSQLMSIPKNSLNISPANRGVLIPKEIGQNLSESVRLTTPFYDSLVKGGLEYNRLDTLKAAANYRQFTARLQVNGDYNIFIGDTVFVGVYEPNTSDLSYLSGFFKVSSVEHSIVSGSFLTNLELYTIGIPFGTIKLFKGVA